MKKKTTKRELASPKLPHASELPRVNPEIGIPIFTILGALTHDPKARAELEAWERTLEELPKEKQRLLTAILKDVEILLRKKKVTTRDIQAFERKYLTRVKRLRALEDRLLGREETK